jgi:O-antigen/teichoic acid export membrane protein
MEASKTYLGFLQGKKKFDTKVKYEILSTVLPVIALVATLYVTNSLLLMILVYFSSHTILNFLFYLRTKNVFDPNEKSDPKTISVGKKQSLINIVNTIANNLDQLLVFHFLGAQELAIYAFAIVLPDKIRDILKSVQHLALPKFACKESGEIKKSFLEKTVRLILVSLPVLIAYVLVAPFLYQFFFPEYLASVRYSQIFALSILANPGLSVAALDAKLAIKEKYIFNIFFGGVRIVLMLLFVLQFGLLGIILAKVIARFLSFFLSLFLIKKL